MAKNIIKSVPKAPKINVSSPVKAPKGSKPMSGVKMSDVLKSFKKA